MRNYIFRVEVRSPLMLNVQCYSSILQPRRKLSVTLLPTVVMKRLLKSATNKQNSQKQLGVIMCSTWKCVQLWQCFNSIWQEQPKATLSVDLLVTFLHFTPWHSFLMAKPRTNFSKAFYRGFFFWYVRHLFTLISFNIMELTKLSILKILEGQFSKLNSPCSFLTARPKTK